MGDWNIFLSAFITLIFIQVLKVIYYTYKKNSKIMKEAFSDGGVVSAHSGVVSALCFSVYLVEGFSNLFFVSLVFAMIVLRDSIGVRRIARENANLLDKKFKLKRGVREGHSVREILAGSLIGAVVSFLVFAV